VYPTLILVINGDPVATAPGTDLMPNVHLAGWKPLKRFARLPDPLTTGLKPGVNEKAHQQRVA